MQLGFHELRCSEQYQLHMELAGPRDSLDQLQNSVQRVGEHSDLILSTQRKRLYLHCRTCENVGPGELAQCGHCYGLVDHKGVATSGGRKVLDHNAFRRHEGNEAVEEHGGSSGAVKQHVPLRSDESRSFAHSLESRIGSGLQAGQGLQAGVQAGPSTTRTAASGCRILHPR